MGDPAAAAFRLAAPLPSRATAALRRHPPGRSRRTIADRAEAGRRAETEHLVGVLAQHTTGLPWGDRHGHHHASSGGGPRGGDRRQHRRSRGEAIIHQHDGASGEAGRGPVAAEGPFPTEQLVLLHYRRIGENARRNREGLHDLVAHDPDAAGCDRAHRELLVTRHSQLADHHDVERSAEGTSHLPAHRHAATRQRKDYRRVQGRAARQRVGEPAPGVMAIAEWWQGHGYGSATIHTRVTADVM
jgi:hypothetical protein